MELGALICTPRSPQCPACPLRKLCVAFRDGRVDALPNPGRRIATTTRRFAAFFVEWQGRFLVRQRPAGVVNAHLWEFPNAELAPASAHPRRAAREALGLIPRALRPLGSLKHSLTRFRITLDAYAVSGLTARQRTRLKGRWLAPARLEKLSFPSAHRRILAQLAGRQP